jgi:putative addiction module CopG family antidote
MPTGNVVLTEPHEEVIDRLVTSGRYQNASEVLREGLRLVEQREAGEEARLAGSKRRPGSAFWISTKACFGTSAPTGWKSSSQSWGGRRVPAPETAAADA